MSSNKDAIAVLAPLLRNTEEAPPLLLLGAGASFRSGVPLAAEAVKRIARIVYAERELHGARSPERVRPTEWEPWLQRFPWFVGGDDRLAENFPLAVEHLLTPAEFRKRVILELTRTNGPSSGYKVLADFVMRGLVHTVLTTNFDTCIPDALRARQPHIRQINEVNRHPGDHEQFNVFNKCQVVWMHGRAEQYSDKNEAGEVGAPDRELVSLLRPLVDGAPIIVIGYRGAEPSIMEGLFAQAHKGRRDFAHGIYWCQRGTEALHPHVEALARRVGSNFHHLRISGFDELFDDLAIELAGFDRYQTSAASARSAIPTFDERVITGLSIDDLDMDLALSVMTEYCAKLKRAPVTRETLPTLMREQGLLVSEGAGSAVTAGAVLLFGKTTQETFSHAVVSVTEDGKRREIYDGNLITQHRKLLEKIESLDVNPLLKVKQRRQHSDQLAYPPRALVELLVNMLVHRDYEITEPSTIDIRQGTEIVFSNPGGLTRKLKGRITIETDGHFTPSENLSDQRNPSLCDIFFGISAMERAGTGLMDVNQLMTESGGGSAFYDFPTKLDAHIRPPHASAGSRSVARSDVPTGIYILNSLPFSVVPENVSIVRLKTPLWERPSTLDLSGCGVFIDRGQELWSFVPREVLAARLEPIVDTRMSKTAPRAEVEASSDDRRVLSWLLRKHWEHYLTTFEDAGLVLEVGRKHRAYFEGKEGGGRTIIWDSPQRRGNRREVVKRRAEGSTAWFENEGFGYDVVQIGGLWTVRIKPFYMFTGHNARTPLPSFTRTRRATSRMKFDRNKSVEADLLFWSTFLGRGNETINVGEEHVDDLLLDAAFMIEEVPEIGLNRDDGENQNRVSA